MQIPAEGNLRGGDGRAPRLAREHGLHRAPGPPAGTVETDLQPQWPRFIDLHRVAEGHREPHRLVQAVGVPRLRRGHDRHGGDRRRRVGRRGVRQDGRRQARRGAGELVARVVRGQRRLGRQVDVHGHRRRRPGRAGHGDRRAVHRARRNAQRGHAARERPVHQRHRNIHRERRPREYPRPRLVGPHLLHRHGERQRIGGVFFQIQNCQRRQAGEQPVGERIQIVAAQIQSCQRGQAGEHVRGKHG